jgi:hypothetical protein
MPEKIWNFNIILPKFVGESDIFGRSRLEFRRTSVPGGRDDIVLLAGGWD